EFKVVVVADAGREKGRPAPDEILALSDGRFGFRVVHPTTGARRPVFDYDAVRDADREREQAEKLRLYYVAMTRAIDRLIVSGAVEPGAATERETPIGWVLRRLEADAELALFERCSYRFYAERIAGLRERRVATGVGEGGLAATEIGDAVHRLLELVDLADPAPPDVSVVRDWYERATDEEVEQIRAFVA